MSRLSEALDKLWPWLKDQTADWKLFDWIKTGVFALFGLAILQAILLQGCVRGMF